jgi:hypothetical protein
MLNRYQSSYESGLLGFDVFHIEKRNHTSILDGPLQLTTGIFCCHDAEGICPENNG